MKFFSRLYSLKTSSSRLGTLFVIIKISPLPAQTCTYPKKWIQHTRTAAQAGLPYRNSCPNMERFHQKWDSWIQHDPQFMNWVMFFSWHTQTKTRNWQPNQISLTSIQYQSGQDSKQLLPLNSEKISSNQTGNFNIRFLTKSSKGWHKHSPILTKLQWSAK